MYFGEENELKFLFRTSSVAVTTDVYATDRIKPILQWSSIHSAKSVSALPRGSTWAGFVV